MARYTHHEPCPSCGSKDNLACYDDGSKWCFGCRHYEPPNNLVRIKRIREKNKNDSATVYLPYDCTTNITGTALRWLYSYGVTKEEIENVGYLWSQQQQLLIVPVYGDEQELLFWNGRNFGNAHSTKYVNRGYRDRAELIINPACDILYLVEDVVSAIKVGRLVASMPMFGSTVPLETLRKLRNRYKGIRIWNDLNLTKESLRTRFKAISAGFTDAQVVCTEKDPKELTNQEIQRCLTL